MTLGTGAAGSAHARAEAVACRPPSLPHRPLAFAKVMAHNDVGGVGGIALRALLSCLDIYGAAPLSVLRSALRSLRVACIAAGTVGVAALVWVCIGGAAGTRVVVSRVGWVLWYIGRLLC